MFSKLLMVWCALVAVEADLVPYTLGGTTIMVERDVLKYSSPLLSHLEKGMPTRRVPGQNPSGVVSSPSFEANKQEEDKGHLDISQSPSQDSFQDDVDDVRNTFSQPSYHRPPFYPQNDFKRDPQGHLNIDVLPEGQSVYPYQQKIPDPTRPIAWEDAGGIYLGEKRVPIAQKTNEQSLYYSVEHPDVSHVSQRIHTIVTSLNQNTAGAKLNDRAPVPMVPPIPDAQRFVNFAQNTQYPAQVESDATKTVPKDYESVNEAVTDHWNFNPLGNVGATDAVTVIGEESATDSYHDDQKFSDDEDILLTEENQRNSTDNSSEVTTISSENSQVTQSDTEEVSETMTVDDQDDNDSHNSGTTVEDSQSTDEPDLDLVTDNPTEDQTSIPLDTVLLQKEEELALLQEEEAMINKKEEEDQKALEQAMADVFGSLFIPAPPEEEEEELTSDTNTESSVTTPENPISVKDSVDSESEIEKQQNAGADSNEPSDTTVQSDSVVSGVTVQESTQKEQSSGVALNDDESQKEISKPGIQNGEQQPVVTAEPSEIVSGTQADSADDQPKEESAHDDDTDTSQIQTGQSISQSDDDDDSVNTDVKVSQDGQGIQDSAGDTDTAQQTTHSEKQQDHSDDKGELPVNQDDNSEVHKNNQPKTAITSTGHEIPIPYHEPSILTDFPQTRGEPEKLGVAKAPPTFHYSSGGLRPLPITINEAAGVYIDSEKVFNKQNPGPVSTYSTRHDPPQPDSGLLTWYDQDPINIFDPLQEDKLPEVEPEIQNVGTIRFPQQPPSPPSPSDNEINVGRPSIPGHVPGSPRPANDDEPEQPETEVADVDNVSVTVPETEVADVDNVSVTVPETEVADVENSNAPNITNTGGAVFHNAQPDLLSKSTCRCGLRFHQKIVGGESANIEQFPWMAGLTTKPDNFSFCGGSLINDRYILTAAHCVYGLRPGDMYIRFGETTRDSTKSVNIDVEKFIIHKNYDIDIVHKDDIALIKLANPVSSFSDRIFPVCLATGKEKFKGSDAVVSGWGRNSFGGDVTEGLMEATVKVLSTKKCQRESDYQDYEVHNKIVCALGEGIDACQGDSGGPLVVLEGDQYNQVGIVSWGIGCAQAKYPGIYTRVSAYKKWIFKNIKDGEGCNRSQQKNKNGNKKKNKNKNKRNKFAVPLFSILNKGGNSAATGGGQNKRGNKRKNQKDEQVAETDHTSKVNEKNNENKNDESDEPLEDIKQNKRKGQNNKNEAAVSDEPSEDNKQNKRKGQNNTRRGQNNKRRGQNNKNVDAESDEPSEDTKQNKRKGQKNKRRGQNNKRRGQNNKNEAAESDQPTEDTKENKRRNQNKDDAAESDQTSETKKRRKNQNNNRGAAGDQDTPSNKRNRNKTKNNKEDSKITAEDPEDDVNWSNLEEALKGIGDIIVNEKSENPSVTAHSSPAQ